MAENLVALATEITELEARIRILQGQAERHLRYARGLNFSATISLHDAEELEREANSVLYDERYSNDDSRNEYERIMALREIKLQDYDNFIQQKNDEENDYRNDLSLIEQLKQELLIMKNNVVNYLKNSQ